MLRAWDGVQARGIRVCGLVGLAAVPVTFLLVRRTELARAVTAALQQKAPASAPAD